MSTREALIQEILKQPGPILREVQRYLVHLLKRQNDGNGGREVEVADTWPPGCFEKTAGAFANEPCERSTQFPFETHEER